jgi:hypothetical protein
MKIFLTGLLFIIALFLSYSMFIIPEYKFRIILALALDTALLILFLYMFFSDYLLKLLSILRTKRAVYIIKIFLLFLVLFILLFPVLESRKLKSLDIDIARSGYVLSGSSINLLSGIKGRVEFYLIKSKNDNEQRFYSYAREFEKHLGAFYFDVINPNIDAVKFRDIQNKVRFAANPGDIVIISDNDFVVTNDISEAGLMNALLTSVNGKKVVCMLNKFSADLFKDFNDKGLGLFNREMSKLGFVFKTVDISGINSCKNLVLINPASDISSAELDALKKFNGRFFISGGLFFGRIKELVEGFGFKVSRDFITDTGSKALVGSGSTPITNIMGLYKNVVLDSPYALTCDDCTPLAFTASTSTVDNRNGPHMVFAEKGNLFIMSSFPGTNYFFRFRANVKMFKNIFYRLTDMELANASYDGTERNSYLLIPPMYLSLLFTFFLIILPLFTCLAGVYLMLKDSLP